VAVPDGVVTVILPVVAPAGTLAVIFADELTVNACEASPLNFTAVAPVKFVPLIVTGFSVAPLVGEKLEIVGVPGDPFASCTALSARMNPKPQSLSGLPASVQSIVLAGLVMIAPSWSGVSEGFACFTSVATPRGARRRGARAAERLEVRHGRVDAVRSGELRLLANLLTGGERSAGLVEQPPLRPAGAVRLGVVVARIVGGDRRHRVRPERRGRVGIDRVGVRAELDVVAAAEPDPLHERVAAPGEAVDRQPDGLGGAGVVGPVERLDRVVRPVDVVIVARDDGSGGMLFAS